ncbi:vWA domain-containing protein [Paracoccus methylarcula]|uniref:VWA domain-containing protein n=1 Tax=Paracoccus methylarcula TaxID=72022 RepID=A0A3R7Q3J0_9RHOB|nr:VWA domain-containing protein [Paracoccus methylarcula]RNF35314.1 VWA domain-containing protein [Paracoccus methylarcula]
MGGLILLRPWWLLALLPLSALMLWSLRRAPDAGGWQRVMPRQMLRAMIALEALGGRQPVWQRMLAPFAIFALILGLTGPALPRRDAPVLAQTDAVIIAIDLSPSVAKGPGLAEAQVAAAGLLQALAGRPVGMILYGGEAYTVAAPTADLATLETQIAVLEPDTLPNPGSRPADALGLAGKLLDKMRRADLILISDGGGVDAQAEAEASRLADQGVRISALRISATAPEAPPAPDDALERLVRGGGKALPTEQMTRLAAGLDRPGAAVRDPVLVALQYRDLGPLLAAFALVPLLIMLRRRK